MHARSFRVVAVTLALGASGASCGEDPAGSRSQANLEISVRPLSLVGVGDVRYRLVVSNGATPPDVVIDRSDLTSQRYGDGKGALSFVAPCDASANPNTIALSILELRDEAQNLIDPSTWQNPAPDGRPVTLSADCIENQDVPVELNLTIMRDAEQGFFDVAVNFEDVFCSAKFDCQGDDGNPIELLSNPATEKRDVTVILGFACTAGAASDGTAAATWLHLTDVLLECRDEDDQPVQYLVDPSRPPGNAGGVGTALYETGIYRGQEQLPGYDKCYWNMAFGVNMSSDVHDCHLLAQGTASNQSFGPTGATPANTIYPYVKWDIDLTGPTGAIACTQNPLNGPDSGVTTDYTAWSGTSFTHEWECDPNTTITTNALACDGLTVTGDGVSFVPEAGGVSVAFGNARSPTYYALPEGYSVGSDAYCCVNPCCSTR